MPATIFSMDLINAPVIPLILVSKSSLYLPQVVWILCQEGLGQIVPACVMITLIIMFSFQIAKAEKLKPLELELKKLEDLSESIVNDFAYMRAREEEMRDTNGTLISILLERNAHLAKG